MTTSGSGSWGGECFTRGCAQPARWIALGEAPTAENPVRRHRCESCCNFIDDIWSHQPSEDELRRVLAADLPELRLMAARAKEG